MAEIKIIMKGIDKIKYKRGLLTDLLVISLLLMALAILVILI